MPDQTRVFIDFQYGAMAGLLQQLITLSLGTLVLSMTFADKIVDIGRAGKGKKAALFAIWSLLVAAIFWSWFALQYLFVAASLARLGKEFGVQSGRAGASLETCSIMFLIAVTALLVTAGHSLFTRRSE